MVLGLGVFFVAMRGGPRGARESLHTESRLGQRAVTIGIVLLFAFGLVVPALVLASNGEHKASVAVGGLHLNAEQVKGRELFAHSCAVCHTLCGGQVGRSDRPEPGRAGGRGHLRPRPGARRSCESAIAEGRARGLGQMPAMLYQGKEAEEVASFVAAVAGH